MKIADRLKRRFVRWLAWQLAVLARESEPAVNATLSPTAILEKEAWIENNQGDPSRIVIGEHTCLRGGIATFGHGGRVQIGDYCYIGRHTEIWSADSVSIGNRVLISRNVNIADCTAHSRHPGERHAHYRAILESRGHPKHKAEVPGVEASPIVIEDDVWINFNVAILQGVRIGARSIIAAGAIVTRDVPPDVLYRCQFNPVITPLK